jgi:flavin reductase (DIM6/NTAB) family NADH-FMN oxidoreductase RutF
MPITMEQLPLSKVSQLLEPGPVVPLRTARKGLAKFKAFGLTPVPGERVKPHLMAACFANLECKLTDTGLINNYNLFILEVIKAWTDPAQKSPKTIPQIWHVRRGW